MMILIMPRSVNLVRNSCTSVLYSFICLILNELVALYEFSYVMIGGLSIMFFLIRYSTFWYGFV